MIFGKTRSLPRRSAAFPPKKRSQSPLPFCFTLIVVFSVWLVWKSLTPILPKPDEPPRLYSNQCQQDLTLTFLEAIRQSTHSLYLVMFGLSDPAILKALENKAKKQIQTTVYYDLNGSPNLYKILETCEIHPIRLPGLMHQKIFIIDDEMVFLGSANMTTQSLRMHDNLVIGFNNKKIASFLKEKVPYSSGHVSTAIGGQDVDLWILPDPKGNALAELRKRLRNATKTIRVALFTLTHPSLLDELIMARRRGVKVTVVVDMHSGLGASAQAVSALKKAKVPVLFSQGTQLLHHKFVYIDEQLLFTGSANWTKAAFTKNSDCLLLLRNLTIDQQSFMNYLWKRIQSTAQAP